MRAVDVVEGSKRHHWSIDKHGVKGQRSPLGHRQPVRVDATHKHLKNLLKILNFFLVSVVFFSIIIVDLRQSIQQCR